MLHVVREWNAGVYHRVSTPQFDWGVRVLDRLPLEGGELVLDVGCGTGRLTELLLARLPRGRVVAVDQSTNMLDAARAFLQDRFGPRVTFVQADASALPFPGVADAIFSTATFHWVLDHDRLFAGLCAALKPGGHLVAQCGGAANIVRLHERCRTLMRTPEFSACFASWTDPWEFASAETTERRLRAAGLVEIRTSVEATSTVMPDAESYREFVATVICRPFLAQIESAEGRARFMTALADMAARDSPAFELDYWRLNMEARKL